MATHQSSNTPGSIPFITTYHLPVGISSAPLAGRVGGRNGGQRREIRSRGGLYSSYNTFPHLKLSSVIPAGSWERRVTQLSVHKPFQSRTYSHSLTKEFRFSGRESRSYPSRLAQCSKCLPYSTLSKEEQGSTCQPFSYHIPVRWCHLARALSFDPCSRAAIPCYGRQKGSIEKITASPRVLNRGRYHI